MLKGRKTILAGIALLVFAASSYFTGSMDLTQGIKTGLEALAIIFLRLGIGLPK